MDLATNQEKTELWLIASMVASDTKWAFVVVLDAPELLEIRLLSKQTALIAKSQGADEERILIELRMTQVSLFSQYGEEESFDPLVLKEISGWVLKQTK